MMPKIGQIVRYRLSENDLSRIHLRQGNPHEKGQEVPLIVVRTWPNEFGTGVPGVNGQAMLDGDGVLWVTSAPEGDGPGTWSAI